MKQGINLDKNFYENAQRKVAEKNIDKRVMNRKDVQIIFEYWNKNYINYTNRN